MTLTLDSSGVLALIDRKDPDHTPCRAVLSSAPGPYLIPAGTLSEITYFLEARHGTPVLDGFLSDLQSGAFTLDCGDRDFARIRELVTRFEDLPLGFADASVAACAERQRCAVLTLDTRDFGVLARAGLIEVLP